MRIKALKKINSQPNPAFDLFYKLCQTLLDKKLILLKNNTILCEFTYYRLYHLFTISSRKKTKKTTKKIKPVK